MTPSNFMFDLKQQRVLLEAAFDTLLNHFFYK